MFQITMQTESDTMKNELYDVIHDVLSTVVEERKREFGLPVLLSKAQLAEHIFNVSPQTLDAHVINRQDFPKLKIGERILFPRDEVLSWIRKNVQASENIAPTRRFGKLQQA